MSDLPAHTPDQAYCRVSALEGGFVNLPLDYIIDTAQSGERAHLPSLSFLLRHTKNDDKLVFDLGIRKDVQNFTPAYLERIKHMTFDVTVPEDAVDALAKGGLAPSDITHILVSHIHFDHHGDPAQFPTSTFLLGAGARPLLENGYPHDAQSLYDSSLFPPDRTRFLDPAEWPSLGPFPHALDFYGDGSLYVVDAGAGHVPGHLNVLARTSPDGGWIYLAGDSAHDRRLLTGEAKIPRHDVFGCAHGDAEAAALHIARIRRLMETYPRVRVMLAHDVPWYEINRDGPGFWPGVIDSL
ncbi:Metallo-hydrolase/oxidoreductase [Earliella scabrosa]|nr:Metallo-hydrolase/oxidoreductase [Earliella scabrosa]